MGNIGGICGRLNIRIGIFDENDKFVANPGNNVLSNCKNSGVIVGNGAEERSVTVAGIAAFAGSMNGKITIDNCSNTGTYVDCGDVIGNGWFSAQGSIELKDLRNEAQVIANNVNESETTNIRAGGVSKNGYLTQVYNAGTIIGENCEYGAINFLETEETISPDTPQRRDNFSNCYYLEQNFIALNDYGISLDSEAIIQQDSYAGFDLFKKRRKRNEFYYVPNNSSYTSSSFWLCHVVFRRNQKRCQCIFCATS